MLLMSSIKQVKFRRPCSYKKEMKSKCIKVWSHIAYGYREMCVPPAKSKTYPYGAGSTILLKQNHLDNLTDKYQCYKTITRRHRYETY